MTISDDDRIAYLAGEPGESLSPQERAELDELRAVLEAPATWAEPDPSLEDRIVATIADAATRRPTPRRRLAVARTPRFRRPAIALGSLATAAAAAIVIAVAVNNGSPVQEQFAMIVTGTSLAPGAHGSATLTKTAAGWRIELSATGLPRRANGLYYEAWLKNPAGILVPVGTFNDAAHVTLWSGVPVTKFRTLTVTQQTANGNPASSGKRVLTGTIRKPH